ncbi:MAG: sigma-70 family RNA polymerase sigma factor, partial [Actinomycetota bacterium]|nr:sigma-70 family RNA polymerase sigma factor [Actinomycetota bacterium]
MPVQSPFRRTPFLGVDTAGTRFEELYRVWYRPVVQMCRRHLGRHRDAEAVAQDAFLRAWAAWDSFAEGRPFGPWVMTIARRLCINAGQLEARRRESLVDLVDVGVLRHPATDDDVDRAIRADTVARAFASLSARDRRLVRLRDLDGWSYADIARFEGVSVDSVRGSLKRARAAFRHSYERLSEVAFGGFALVWRALSALRTRSSRAMRACDQCVAVLGRRLAGVDVVGVALVAALV